MREQSAVEAPACAAIKGGAARVVREILGGRYWIGVPDLLLEISQPGSTGYVATASGALDATGGIVIISR
jgi:hypothetical protein